MIEGMRPTEQSDAADESRRMPDDDDDIHAEPAHQPLGGKQGQRVFDECDRATSPVAAKAPVFPQDLAGIVEAGGGSCSGQPIVAQCDRPLERAPIGRLVVLGHAVEPIPGPQVAYTRTGRMRHVERLVNVENVRCFG